MGLIYTLFYLCELVGLLVFMLKLCHISLCSLNMVTYGFNLYLVLFMWTSRFISFHVEALSYILVEFKHGDVWV